MTATSLYDWAGYDLAEHSLGTTHRRELSVVTAEDSVRKIGIPRKGGITIILQDDLIPSITDDVQQVPQEKAIID